MKPAFVNTEAGLVPEDWIVESLFSLFKTFSSASYSREQSKEGNIVYIHYGDIHTKFGNIVEISKDSLLPHITEKQAKTYQRLQSGDLLLADASEDLEGIGKAVIVLCNDCKAIAGLHTIPLRSRVKNKFYITFPTFLFAGDIVKNQIERLSEGTKVNSITYQKIKDVKLAFPKTKKEQKQIAEVLTDTDKLIASLEKTIAKQKAILQGTMDDLLTAKKRLPDFSKPWVEKKVRDLGKLTGAGVDKTSNEGEIPVRLVNFLDVYHRNKIASSELKHWVTAPVSKVNSCNVKMGDIFFTPSSEMPDDIGQSAMAIEDMDNVCYSYHVYRLRLYEDIDIDYRAFLFQNKNFFNQVRFESEGSGKRYVVSLRKFREITTWLPSDKKEQTAIARVLIALEDEIKLLEMELDKYRKIRAGLMDDLLTGRKRTVSFK